MSDRVIYLYIHSVGHDFNFLIVGLFLSIIKVDIFLCFEMVLYKIHMNSPTKNLVSALFLKEITINAKLTKVHQHICVIDSRVKRIDMIKITELMK